MLLLQHTLPNLQVSLLSLSLSPLSLSLPLSPAFPPLYSLFVAFFLSLHIYTYIYLSLLLSLLSPPSLPLSPLHLSLSHSLSVFACVCNVYTAKKQAVLAGLKAKRDRYVTHLHTQRERDTLSPYVYTAECCNTHIHTRAHTYIRYNT